VRRRSRSFRHVDTRRPLRASFNDVLGSTSSLPRPHDAHQRERRSNVVVETRRAAVVRLRVRFRPGLRVAVQLRVSTSGSGQDGFVTSGRRFFARLEAFLNISGSTYIPMISPTGFILIQFPLIPGRHSSSLLTKHLLNCAGGALTLKRRA
jgi:hypothetical protein